MHDGYQWDFPSPRGAPGVEGALIILRLSQAPRLKFPLQRYIIPDRASLPLHVLHINHLQVSCVTQAEVGNGQSHCDWLGAACKDAAVPLVVQVAAHWLDCPSTGLESYVKTCLSKSCGLHQRLWRNNKPFSHFRASMRSAQVHVMVYLKPMSCSCAYLCNFVQGMASQSSKAAALQQRVLRVLAIHLQPVQDVAEVSSS
jgi:hypothetical protein